MVSSARNQDPPTPSEGRGIWKGAVVAPPIVERSRLRRGDLQTATVTGPRGGGAGAGAHRDVDGDDGLVGGGHREATPRGGRGGGWGGGA